MTLPGSGLWVVFNGEIYNFLELRRELEARGRRFVSDTDTEVVLAAYDEWGDAAFERFNGMWALALLDETKRRLLLCRDRYGVKPLYYWQSGAGLAFASECKALLAVGRKLKLDWDPVGLRTALEDPFLLESSGKTLFAGVNDLPPGHLLVADGSTVRLRQWWSTLDHVVDVPKSEDERVERFRDLFSDACRLRLRSDVPVGTSLSGGLDSSSIVSMVAALMQRGGLGERTGEAERVTFIHRFRGDPLDETAYADLVADVAGVRKVYVDASEENVSEEVDRTLVHFEGLYGGMPDSAWRIYKAQRAQGVVVTLDGQGGDELLGGYPWHVLAAMSDTSFLDPRYWRLMRQHRAMYGDRAPHQSVLRALANTTPSLEPLLRYVRRLKGPGPGKLSFLTSEADRIDIYAPRPLEASPSGRSLDQVLFTDSHLTVLPRILRNFDLMSMAHGVEVRMPLMDFRLVSFAFSLPGRCKVGDDYSKDILRRAMRGLLPDTVRLRTTKVGFNSPIGSWLQGRSRPWVEDVLSTGAPQIAALISVPALRSFYRKRVLSGSAGWSEVLRFWIHLSALRLAQRLVIGGSD
jgi:asparagine synthase (glutamine-hydrolysing)